MPGSETRGGVALTGRCAGPGGRCGSAPRQWVGGSTAVAPGVLLLGLPPLEPGALSGVCPRAWPGHLE